MCDKILSHPIPKPPLSLIVEKGVATISHPNYSNIDELSGSEEDYIIRQFTFIRKWCDTHQIELNSMVKPYVIDERMTLRQIAQTIETIFIDTPETYFYIRELTTDTSFGFDISGTRDELMEQFKSIPTTSIVRTGLNQTLQKKGAFIFELYQHSIP